MADSLAAWKDRGTEELKLPSGATVVVRRSPADFLWMSGVLPNEILLEDLRQERERVQQREAAGEDAPAVVDELPDVEDLERRRRRRILRVVAALVEPKITEVDWSSIPDEDKVALLEWIDRPEEVMAELARFSDDGDGGPAGGSGATVGDEAEQDPGGQ